MKQMQIDMDALKARVAALEVEVERLRYPALIAGGGAGAFGSAGGRATPWDGSIGGPGPQSGGPGVYHHDAQGHLVPGPAQRGWDTTGPSVGARRSTPPLSGWRFCYAIDANRKATELDCKHGYYWRPLRSAEGTHFMQCTKCELIASMPKQDFNERLAEWLRSDHPDVDRPWKDAHSGEVERAPIERGQ